jgi:hypothetical protein
MLRMFVVSRGIKYSPTNDSRSPPLQKKTTVPCPSIQASESSPNLMVPYTVVSRSWKATREPVIWLVALVSRTHTEANRFSSAPRCMNVFYSRNSTRPSDLGLAGTSRSPVANLASRLSAASLAGDQAWELSEWITMMV